MTKIIKFETDTWIYKLDLSYVASNRAAYYANREYPNQESEEFKKEFSEEYNYVMADEYEWIDWLLNNTDPIDFKWNIHLIETKNNKELDDWNDYELFEISEEIIK